VLISDLKLLFQMFPDVKNTIGTCREHHLWDSFAGTIKM
jgi:hypothetical protein